MPPTLSPINSHSPVCTPARTSIPSCLTASAIASAQRTARAGPSNVARKPSPVVLVSFPRKARQFLSHNGVIRVQKIAPARVPKLGGALGGGGDVDEEHRRQDPIGGIDWALAGDEFLDVRQHGFHVIEHHRVTVTRIFLEFCARNPRGHVARGFNASARITRAIHHQGGRLNRRQESDAYRFAPFICS